MKNKQTINPIGLKGREIYERQLALMGMSPINENENKSKSAVELTKVGPDGNAYAIIRENHEYYIKRTDKTTGLVLEDFKYIGGLQNKKNEAYPSYAKAIKQLNLKFKSLAEAYNRGGDINVFEDDNLLNERAFGMGFSNEGNLDGHDELNIGGAEEITMGDDLEQEPELNEFEAAIEEMMAREENLNLGDDIMNYNAEKDPFGDEDEDYVDYTMGNEEDPNQLPNPPRELNIPEELHGRQYELDVDNDEDIEASDLAALRAMEESIAKLDNMITSLTEGTVKKKVATKK